MWNKVQTVGNIKQFVSNDVGAGIVPLASLPVAVEDREGVISSFINFLQNPSEALADKFYDMVAPLLDILGLVAYPVASIIMGVCGILYILNFREKSVIWMTKTSIIYVLVQLLPMLLQTALDMITSY